MTYLNSVLTFLSLTAALPPEAKAFVASNSLCYQNFPENFCCENKTCLLGETLTLFSTCYFSKFSAELLFYPRLLPMNQFWHIKHHHHHYELLIRANKYRNHASPNGHCTSPCKTLRSTGTHWKILREYGFTVLYLFPT